MSYHGFKYVLGDQEISAYEKNVTANEYFMLQCTVYGHNAPGNVQQNTRLVGVSRAVFWEDLF